MSGRLRVFKGSVPIGSGARALNQLDCTSNADVFGAGLN